MNSRIAQIIADAMDDQGKVDRKKVFRSLSLSPDDPSALIVDACLLLEEVPHRLEKQVRQAQSDIGKTFEAMWLRLQQDLKQADKLQSLTLSNLEHTAQIAEKSTLANASASGTMERTIRGAFDDLDLERLREKLFDRLEKETLTPFHQAVGKLEETTTQIDQATKTAEEAVNAWKKIHLRAIVLTCAGVFFVLFGSVYFLSWSSLKDQTRHEIAKAIATQTNHLQDNKEVLRELAILGVSLELKDASDNGTAIPGVKAVVANHAVNAFLAGQARNKGIVLVKSPRTKEEIALFRQLAEQNEGIQDMIEALKAPQKDGPATTKKSEGKK